MTTRHIGVVVRSQGMSATTTAFTLAEELARLTPQQPATVLWRAIELEHLLSEGLPQGLGLDLGCGDGSIVQLLRRHGADWGLVGIDPDPAETALAERSRQYERVHTAPGDAVPEPDATFEFVFSNSVLEHIHGLPAVLAEAARVLKPGGTFLATVPSASLNTCLRGPGVLAPLLGRSRSSYLRRMDDRTAHQNLWPTERWERELDAVGIDLVRATAYLSGPQARAWERLSNWTGGLAYAASGRKPIAVNRALGLETTSRRGTKLAPVAARIVTAALGRVHDGPDSGDPHDRDYGCLLIRGTRR